ncbi:DUF4326 domain-containing protein [Myxococcota bacterium]|nr:DUF4326 domain-containing protein [Myxococcota bacterium]
MADPRVLVVSRRKGAAPAPDGAVVVYVGRAMPQLGIAGSSLGNPFRVPHGYDVATDPDDVLGRYRRWLDERLTDPTSAQSVEVSRLADIVRSGDTLALECWCAPGRCHADVIRDVLIERLGIVVHAKRCPAAERNDAHAKAAGYTHTDQAHHDRRGHWCVSTPAEYVLQMCRECEREGCDTCPRFRTPTRACTCGAEARS